MNFLLKSLPFRFNNCLKRLDDVCDLMDGESTTLFRLSDEKLLKWLNCKISRLKGYFLRKGTPKDESLKTAVSVIVEYLEPETATDLLNHYKYLIYVTKTQVIAFLRKNSNQIARKGQF